MGLVLPPVSSTLGMLPPGTNCVTVFVAAVELEPRVDHARQQPAGAWRRTRPLSPSLPTSTFSSQRKTRKRAGWGGKGQGRGSKPVGAGCKPNTASKVWPSLGLAPTAPCPSLSRDFLENKDKPRNHGKELGNWVGVVETILGLALDGLREVAWPG